MRKIKDLSRDEMEMILETIHNEMYAERDNDAEDENTVVVVMNPDKEVNGGDLVDLVNDLFMRHDTLPRENPELQFARALRRMADSGDLGPGVGDELHPIADYLEKTASKEVLDADNSAPHTLEFVRDTHGATIVFDGRNIGVIDVSKGSVTCYKFNEYGEASAMGYHLN